jgi:predicted RND superfamily exporter protein
MAEDRAENRLTRIGVCCAQRPWTTLGVALIVGGVALAMTLRLKPTASIDSLYGTRDPASVALVRVATEFGSADQLLVWAQLPAGAPGDADGVARLKAFSERLSRAVESLPHSKSLIASVADRPPEEARQFVEQVMMRSLIYYLDDDALDAFLQRLSPEGLAEQWSRNRALIESPSPLAKDILKNDPMRLHQWYAQLLQRGGPRLNTLPDEESWVSADGRALLIRVTVRHPVSDMDRTKQLMQLVRDAVDVAGPEGLKVDYAGGYAMAEVAEREISRDMKRSVIISVILLQIAFLIAYRGWICFPLSIIPVALGILAGMACYTLWSTVLTPITAVIGALLAGLGVDYCIHMISHYHARRAAGDAPLEAATLGGGLGTAMLAACVTSAIAFGAIWFSSIDALRSFSTIGVLGLVGAFLGSVTLLPALLVWTDRFGSVDRRPIRVDIAPLIGAVARRRRPIWMAGGVLVMVGAGGAVSLGDRLLAFDDGLWQMHPTPNRPIEVQKQIQDALSMSGDTLMLHLDESDSDALLVQAHQVARRVGRPSEGRHVSGLHSLLPDPSRAKSRRRVAEKIDPDQFASNFLAAADKVGFDPEIYRSYVQSIQKQLRPGPSPGLATLRKYPTLAASVLPKSESEDQSQALSIVRFSQTMTHRADRDRAAEQVVRDLDGLDGATLTGMSVVGAQIRNTVATDLPRLLGAALLAVVVWLLILFRRPKDVAMALCPMMFALLMLVIGMHWTGTQWHMINLLALPLIVGIGIDDGIFLVSIAARAKKDGVSRGELVSRLAASCHAITLTSLTTGLAFGSLLFTSTPAIRSLGTVFAIGILGCWAGSVLWLTAIVISCHRESDSV